MIFLEKGYFKIYLGMILSQELQFFRITGPSMRKLSGYELANVAGQRNISTIEIGGYDVPFFTAKGAKKFVDKVGIPAVIAMGFLGASMVSSELPVKSDDTFSKSATCGKIGGVALVTCVSVALIALSEDEIDDFYAYMEWPKE